MGFKVAYILKSETQVLKTAEVCFVQLSSSSNSGRIFVEEDTNELTLKKRKRQVLSLGVSNMPETFMFSILSLSLLLSKYPLYI